MTFNGQRLPQLTTQELQKTCSPAFSATSAAIAAPERRNGGTASVAVIAEQAVMNCRRDTP